MQEGDRDACYAILTEIYAGLDKPFGDIQKSTLWKGLAKMSIGELARVRDLLIDEWAQEKPPRTFGVPDLWAAKRRLRATAPPVATVPRDDWQGDKWDEIANMRLRKHINELMYADPKQLGRPASLDRMKKIKTPNADASPEFVRNVETLVFFKNRWADLMRASADSGEVTETEQLSSWDESMRIAMAEIAARRVA